MNRRNAPCLAIGNRLISVSIATCAHLAQAQSIDAPLARALPAPHAIFSVNGVASIDLEAREDNAMLGEVAIDSMTYNGDYAGPVVHVRPGDLLQMRLTNHLHESTNIHFHGYQGSPQGRADNMHIEVKPGESFDYEFAIPKTQPPGLYWFHPHMHEAVERQLLHGLSGTIVVDGIEEQIPELARLTQQLMVIKEYQFESSEVPLVNNYFHRYLRSISGNLLTRLTMRPGETQFWRFSNENANKPVRLLLTGHKFRIVALDGAVTTREIRVDELVIPPAGRAEVLVDAGGPGRYELYSPDVFTGKGKKRDLAWIEVSGDAASTLPEIMHFPTTPDLRSHRIDAERTVVLTEEPAEAHYFIDGKLFSMARLDARIPLGNVERWTIRNDSDDYHSFHIHQLAFQVTQINGVDVPFDGRRDTVEVPARGSITVLLPFLDPLIVGDFMYHCHVLQHEDLGMMATIEVYDPKALGESTSESAPKTGMAGDGPGTLVRLTPAAGQNSAQSAR